MKEVLQKTIAAVRDGRWDIVGIGLAMFLGKLPGAIRGFFFPSDWPGYIAFSLLASLFLELPILVFGFQLGPERNNFADLAIWWLVATGVTYLITITIHWPLGWLNRRLLHPAGNQLAYVVKDAKKNWRDYEPDQREKVRSEYHISRESLDRLLKNNPSLNISLNDDGELVESNR